MIILKFSKVYIWPIDITLTGATQPGENEPGNNGNGGVTPHYLEL